MSAPDEEQRIPKGEPIAHKIRTFTGKCEAIHWRQYYENAPKKLWWEQADGTKGLGKRAPSSLAFYNSDLVRLFDAVRVVITEGEPAAKALTDLGILALGTVTGSGGCPDAAVFKETVDNLPMGAYLILWPDNAADGFAHMDKVAAGFRAAGVQDIRQRSWVQGPPKGDAADYVKGKTLAEVLAFIDLASPYPFASEWPEPEPLPEGLLPVAPYVGSMLPVSLRDWVGDIAERMQCPPDFVAAAVVVVIASLVGRQVGIRPKREDDWIVVPNLWGAVVGEPGLMKTPALQEAMKPLMRLVAEDKERFDAEQKQTAFEITVAALRKALLEADLKKAMKDNDTDRIAEIKVSMEAAETAAVPIERRRLVNDATVEKLGVILNENPIGVLQHRDEIPGWLATMDREGHENDRAFFNEAWNGTGSYTYDRMARGTLTIKAVCVSVLGGIQPGPLQAYLHEIFASGLTNDGMIQRFQVMVWPDPVGEWTNVDRWPNVDAKNAAYVAISRLAGLTPVLLGALPDEGGVPYLRFSPDAQAIFDTWRAQLEARLRPGGEDGPVVISHLTKYRSLMPSLALLFHLVDGGTGAVSAEAAQQAAAWCTYLETHARRVYQSITQSGTTAAVAIAQKITTGKLKGEFRARTITQKGWAGLTEPKLVARGLDTLLELNWIREKDEDGRKKTVTYEINPKVLQGSPEGSEGGSSRVYTENNPPPPPPKNPDLYGETNPQNPQEEGAQEEEPDPYLTAKLEMVNAEVLAQMIRDRWS